MSASVGPASATAAAPASRTATRFPPVPARGGDDGSALPTQVRQCRAQLRRRSPGPGRLLAIGSVAFEQFKRQEELTARGMEGKRLEQSGKGISKSGVTAERVDIEATWRRSELSRQGQ